MADKAVARERCTAALRDTAFRAGAVGVRVNAIGSALFLRDVEALVLGAGPRLNSLLLPKVESAAQLHHLDLLLDALQEEAGDAAPITYVVQIESCAGLVALAEIAAASRRTEAIAFGPADYAADLGVPQGHLGVPPEGFPGHAWHWPMSEIAHHARAAGLQALHGPTGDFHDADAFAESARHARFLGFQGRHCIHPAQVPWATRAFTPEAAEIERAERTLAALADGADRGQGALTFDGRMIDAASRRSALAILRLARIADVPPAP